MIRITRRLFINHESEIGEIEEANTINWKDNNGIDKVRISFLTLKKFHWWQNLLNKI
jgi:hypothetical protein